MKFMKGILQYIYSKILYNRYIYLNLIQKILNNIYLYIYIIVIIIKYNSIKEDFKDDEEAQAILCERFVNNVDINDSEFPLKLKMSVDAFEKCVTVS